MTPERHAERHLLEARFREAGQEVLGLRVLEPGKRAEAEHAELLVKHRRHHRPLEVGDLQMLVDA